MLGHRQRPQGDGEDQVGATHLAEVLGQAHGGPQRLRGPVQITRLPQRAAEQPVDVGEGDGICATRDGLVTRLAQRLARLGRSALDEQGLAALGAVRGHQSGGSS